MSDDAALFASLYEGAGRETTTLTGRRLFVRGLPFEWDKPRIRAEFGRFGAVERLEVTKARRGTCLVDYERARDASRALLDLDGQSYGRTRLAVAVEAVHRPPIEDEDECEEDGPPLQFSGRGVRADEERARHIERKYKQSRVFCNLCASTDHFPQGCFLKDKRYHADLVAGTVADPDSYRRSIRQPEPKQEHVAPPKPVAPPRGRGAAVIPAWMKDPELAKQAVMRPKPAEPRVVTEPEPQHQRQEEKSSKTWRQRRREEAAAREQNVVDEWRGLVSNALVWPLEGSGLYVSYDLDSSKLELCRALPSGRQVRIDATPSRDITRRINQHRLDVASDAMAAVNAVCKLMDFKTSTFDESKRDLLAAEDDLPPLPPHISTHWSTEHLAYYYYDTQSGGMSWERPVPHKKRRY